MNQAIVAERRAERRTVKAAAFDNATRIRSGENAEIAARALGTKMPRVSVAGAVIPTSRTGRAAEPRMSPRRTAEAAVLAFDADAVLFELGVASPRWSYDGVRPQLRFSFDAGQAIAALQDAPARNISCSPGSFALLSPGMRVRVSHTTPLEILALTFGPEALAGRADIAAVGNEPPIQITNRDVCDLAP